MFLCALFFVLVFLVLFVFIILSFIYYLYCLHFCFSNLSILKFLLSCFFKIVVNLMLLVIALLFVTFISQYTIFFSVVFIFYFSFISDITFFFFIVWLTLKLVKWWSTPWYISELSHLLTNQNQQCCGIISLTHHKATRSQLFFISVFFIEVDSIYTVKHWHCLK